MRWKICIFALTEIKKTGQDTEIIEKYTNISLRVSPACRGGETYVFSMMWRAMSAVAQLLVGPPLSNKIPQKFPDQEIHVMKEMDQGSADFRGNQAPADCFT